ncbi:MAG: GxxExxY protein [Verrucomicrobiae bacterium]|nr:GxxExxY protein [Verrucomicrobiae bacterium]
MSSKDPVFELCDRVRELGFDAHRFLGPGHLEKVYENALVNRLRRAGIKVEQQHPMSVYDDDGTILGNYFADLFIEDCLIAELKATRSVAPEHVSQILGYLRASRIKDGLLINFGAPRFYIKKYVLEPLG